MGYSELTCSEGSPGSSPPTAARQLQGQPRSDTTVGHLCWLKSPQQTPHPCLQVVLPLTFNPEPSGTCRAKREGGLGSRPRACFLWARPQRAHSDHSAPEPASEAQRRWCGPANHPLAFGALPLFLFVNKEMAAMVHHFCNTLFSRSNSLGPPLPLPLPYYRSTIGINIMLV